MQKQNKIKANVRSTPTPRTLEFDQIAQFFSNYMKNNDIFCVCYVLERANCLKKAKFCCFCLSKVREINTKKFKGRILVRTLQYSNFAARV